MRVVVWSPFEQLARELRRLIDGSGDAHTVELGRQGKLGLAIRDSGAQLAVLDVDSVTGSCGAFIADIWRTAGDVSILALSAKSDARLVANAFSAGARGYVLKDRAFEELREAVRALATGDRYLSPALDRQAVECFETAEPSRSAFRQARRGRPVGHCEPDNRVRPDRSGDESGA